MNKDNNKYKNIKALQTNRYLNFYHMDALTDSGRVFDYYFVSRNNEENIKIKTGENKAEGIVIYAVLEEDPSKIVLIRQYRYPVGDYLYELPAGLVDSGETIEQAAIREMKEETGLDFVPYNGGSEFFRRPFYMGAGYTDEASSAVFGYAKGDFMQNTEDTESIEVCIADKSRIRQILSEEKVSLRMAYLMMNFLQSDEKEPFRFLTGESN